MPSNEKKKKRLNKVEVSRNYKTNNHTSLIILIWIRLRIVSLKLTKKRNFDGYFKLRVHPQYCFFSFLQKSNKIIQRSSSKLHFYSTDPIPHTRRTKFRKGFSTRIYLKNFKKQRADTQYSKYKIREIH